MGVVNERQMGIASLGIRRMPAFRLCRALRVQGHRCIDAIHSGALAKARTERGLAFGFDIVTECPGVPPEILVPRNAWADKSAYDAAGRKLADLFKHNFKTYEGGASAEVTAAGPA
jgi:ATP-dependent phosphoenolpyruvate carboxykinase